MYLILGTLLADSVDRRLLGSSGPSPEARGGRRILPIPPVLLVLVVAAAVGWLAIG